MANRTEKVVFYATPAFKERLDAASDELSTSEIVRRGALREVQRLEGDAR